MLDKNSDEYKAVAALFESGKITAEQRDALLDALDDNSDDKSAGDAHTTVFRVFGMENPYDASRISKAVSKIDGVTAAGADVKTGRLSVVGGFDVDKVLGAIRSEGFTAKCVDIKVGDKVEINLGNAGDVVKVKFGKHNDGPEEPEDPEDPEDPEEPEDWFDDDDDGATVNVHVKGKKSLGDKIKNIAIAVNKKVGDIDRQITDALSDLYGDLYGSLCDGKDKDATFEEMTVRIEYCGRGKNIERKCKGADVDGIIKSCEGMMSDECYAVVKKILDRDFRGVYDYQGQGELLTISVKPI